LTSDHEPRDTTADLLRTDDDSMTPGTNPELNQFHPNSRPGTSAPALSRGAPCSPWGGWEALCHRLVSVFSPAPEGVRPVQNSRRWRHKLPPPPPRLMICRVRVEQWGGGRRPVRTASAHINPFMLPEMLALVLLPKTHPQRTYHTCTHLVHANHRQEAGSGRQRTFQPAAVRRGSVAIIALSVRRRRRCVVGGLRTSPDFH
jgi:hypothetical protein